jgi:curved DNA-binding protein
MKTRSKDYYGLLGVEPGATTAQIKSAYRKLAKQYHPDLNSSPDAAGKFREITEAYDTLTDPDRRRRYDRLHGTGRTTFTEEDEWSRYTRPGNDTRAGDGSARSTVSQAASPILKVLEDIWLEIRRWHPDIPRP